MFNQFQHAIEPAKIGWNMIHVFRLDEQISVFSYSTTCISAQN